MIYGPAHVFDKIATQTALFLNGGNEQATIIEKGFFFFFMYLFILFYKLL
jgi:hypothetical protein